MTKSINIQGYIRFSYVGKTDTKMSTRFDDDKLGLYKAVFDPLRMERRFHLFEKLCLPGLRQQTDQDFSVVLIASTDMPETYKSRLEKAVKNTPQVCIRYSSSPTVLHATRPVVRRFVEEAEANTIHFRLDDDDVLGRNAIALIKEYGARAVPDTIISLKFGYRLFKLEDRALFLPEDVPFHSVGWARVNGPGDFRSPLKFSHTQAATRFPTIQVPCLGSYVYTMHEESDTRVKNNSFIEQSVAARPSLFEAERQNELAASVDAEFPALGHRGLQAALYELPGGVEAENTETS